MERSGEAHHRDVDLGMVQPLQDGSRPAHGQAANGAAGTACCGREPGVDGGDKVGGKRGVDLAEAVTVRIIDIPAVAETRSDDHQRRNAFVGYRLIENRGEIAPGEPVAVLAGEAVQQVDDRPTLALGRMGKRRIHRVWDCTPERRAVGCEPVFDDAGSARLGGCADQRQRGETYSRSDFSKQEIPPKMNWKSFS
jgi:hypothetical protein